MRRIFPAPAGETSKPRRIPSRSRSTISNNRLNPLDRDEPVHGRNTKLHGIPSLPDFMPQNHPNPTKPKISGMNLPDLPRGSGPPPRTPTPIPPGQTLKFGISNILQHNRSPGNPMGRARFDELLAEEEARLHNSRARGHDQELKLLIAPKVSKIPEARLALERDYGHAHTLRLGTPPAKKGRAPKEYMTDRGESLEDDLETEIYNYVVPPEESVTSHGDASEPAFNFKGSTAKINAVEIKPIKLKPKRPKTVASSYPFELHTPPFPPSPLAAKPLPTPVPKSSRATNAEKTSKPPATEDKISPSQTKITANAIPIIEPETPEPAAPEQPCTCAVEHCPKCTALQKKWKKEAEMTRTLQRQNGCLEGIITQKRNLAEQLTRQVRVLMKENMQLAKGMQAMNKVLKTDIPIPSDSASATNISSTSTPVKANATPSEPILPVKKTKTKNRPGTRARAAQKVAKPPASARSQSEKRTPTASSTRASSSRGPSRTRKRGSRAATPDGNHDDPESRSQREIASLKSAVDVLQFKLSVADKDNKEINSFLTDLLYTLNARGYETVTDHRGHVVDLYRCRGEHLLELKGRDARARMPVKKLVQQENLLKAVIGSQERFIQRLISQLQDKQKDALIGKRLSSSSSEPNSSNQSADERNAAMEQEIFILIGLLESACQRNPEVYSALRDEQQGTLLATGAGSLIIEAVMERYERLVNPPQQQQRPRIRENYSSRSDTPPQSRRRTSANDPRTRDRDRETISQGHQYHLNNAAGPSQGPPRGYPENLSIINLQKNAYGPMPSNQKIAYGHPVPSHTQTRNANRRKSSDPFSTDHRNRGAPGPLRPATTSTNFLAFPPDNLIHFRSGSAHAHARGSRPATSSLVDGGAKRLSTTIPSKCSFCGEKFPSHMTLAQINEHIDMHVSPEHKQH